MLEKQIHFPMLWCWKLERKKKRQHISTQTNKLQFTSTKKHTPQKETHIIEHKPER